MPEMKSANFKGRSKDNPKYFRGDEQQSTQSRPP